MRSYKEGKEDWDTVMNGSVNKWIHSNVIIAMVGGSYVKVIMGLF